MSQENRPEEELDIKTINANARAQAEEIRKKKKAETIGHWVGFLLFLVVFIPACIEYGFDTLDGMKFWGLMIWILICGIASRIVRWIVRPFLS